MKKVENFEDVITIHQEFLNDCLANSMLLDEGLREILLNVYEDAVDFAQEMMYITRDLTNLDLENLDYIEEEKSTSLQMREKRMKVHI